MPPKPRFVTIPYAMDLPHDVDAAYAWLTDYTDDDPNLTDAIVKRRPVLERHPDRVVLESEIDFVGRRLTGRATIHLRPEEHAWYAELERGGRYEYKLTPRAGGGSRLHVAYHVRVRSLKGWLKVTLAKPFAKREIDKMWKGFARSMARDLEEAAQTQA